MKPKRKKHGRPSQGIDETRVLVPMPQQLAADAEAAARQADVSRAEWIRAAMRAALEAGR